MWLYSRYDAAVIRQRQSEVKTSVNKHWQGVKSTCTSSSSSSSQWDVCLCDVVMSSVLNRRRRSLRRDKASESCPVICYSKHQLAGKIVKFGGFGSCSHTHTHTQTQWHIHSHTLNDRHTHTLTEGESSHWNLDIVAPKETKCFFCPAETLFHLYDSHTHTHTHTHAHTHAHTHTHTHKHSHTHTHTHTQSLMTQRSELRAEEWQTAR